MRLSNAKKKLLVLLLCVAIILSINVGSGRILRVTAEMGSDDTATVGDASLGDADPLIEDEIILQSELPLNFAVVEEPRFDTPAENKYIVVDLGDGTTQFENPELVLINEYTGLEMTCQVDTIMDSTLLFYASFPDESYSGVYRVASIRYEVDGAKYEKNLMDEGVAPKFGVNYDKDAVPDLVITEDNEIIDPSEEVSADTESVLDAGVTSEYSDEIIDMSSEFANANVIAIDGENSNIDLEEGTIENSEVGPASAVKPEGDDSVDVVEPVDSLNLEDDAKDVEDTNDSSDSSKEESAIDISTEYASCDEYIASSVDEAVAKITKEINKSTLLTTSLNDLVFSASPGNIVIVLDPGHGGVDSGACYTWNNVQYCERDINQKIANACKAELQKHTNVTVYLTRNSTTEALHGSTGEDLQWRCDFAHNVGADLFVSLHCNSSASVNARKGAEVYIPNSSYSTSAYNVGKKVGETIGSKLKALGLSNGSTYTRSSETGNTYSDGSIADYYAVIRGCKKYGIPGMIVEHAYVNNQTDCETFFGNDTAIANLGITDANAIADNIGLIQQNRVESGANAVGWVQTNTSYIYYNDKGKMVTGFFSVDGQKYYAGENGEIVYGWQLIKGSYYLFSDSGAMVTNKWVQDTNGKWMFLGEDGKMATGVVTADDGNKYLINNDGIMLTGWQQFGNAWYYMDSSGVMYVNRWILGSAGWYYLGSDGRMAAGTTIDDGGVKYYLNSSGVMATGWIWDGAHWFYANSSGAISYNAWAYVGGAWYYFLADGRMATGFTKAGTWYYYLDKVNGDMKSNWFKIDNNWYLADASGALYQNQWAYIGNQWFYIQKDFKMAEGFREIDGEYYYLTEGNGDMKYGWFKVGADWYYANASGALVRGTWLLDGNLWYYFDPNCKMATGYRIIDGVTYQFSENGNMIGTVTGTVSTTDSNTASTDSNTTSTTVSAAVEPTTTVNETTTTTTTTESTLHTVMGATTHSAESLAARYIREGKTYPTTSLANGGAPDINTFCRIIVEEAQAEGVRAELVFAQIMNETGWLQFGGTVSISQYNFCGLGATSSTNPGNSFADVRTGIRAQVQHLKAYGSTASLNQACVDPRFSYVTRGCAVYIEHLGIQENPNGKGWAAQKDYGNLLMNLIYSL